MAIYYYTELCDVVGWDFDDTTHRHRLAVRNIHHVVALVPIGDRSLTADEGLAEMERCLIRFRGKSPYRSSARSYPGCPQCGASPLLADGCCEGCGWHGEPVERIPG